MPFNIESRKLSLDSIQNKHGDTWVLKEPVMYYWRKGTNPLESWIVAQPGMHFDLASIPGWAKWFVSNDDWRVRRPSAIHDWLYYNKGKLPTGVRYTREQCDDIFHDALIEEGVNSFKAWCMWAAVRVGGGGYWSK